MAPIWMKTANIFQNPSCRSRRIHRSHRSRWPVELIGRNSVTPSTIPRMIAFNRSGNALLRLVHGRRALDVQHAADDGDGDGGPDAEVAQAAGDPLVVVALEPAEVIDVDDDDQDGRRL